MKGPLRSPNFNCANTGRKKAGCLRAAFLLPESSVFKEAAPNLHLRNRAKQVKKSALVVWVAGRTVEQGKAQFGICAKGNTF